MHALITGDIIHNQSVINKKKRNSNVNLRDRFDDLTLGPKELYPTQKYVLITGNIIHIQSAINKKRKK